MPQTKAIGDAAESLAEQYLIQQGLQPVARNYRSRYGEIDIICFGHNTWVFVEVKNRKNAFFGSAIEAVTVSKQKKIIAAAQHFLLCESAAKKRKNANIRFDVIGMENLQANTITWIQSAFDCGGY